MAGVAGASPSPPPGGVSPVVGPSLWGRFSGTISTGPPAGFSGFSSVVSPSGGPSGWPSTGGTTSGSCFGGAGGRRPPGGPARGGGVFVSGTSGVSVSGGVSPAAPAGGLPSGGVASAGASGASVRPGDADWSMSGDSFDQSCVRIFARSAPIVRASNAISPTMRASSPLASVNVAVTLPRSRVTSPNSTAVKLSRFASPTVFCGL